MNHPVEPDIRLRTALGEQYEIVRLLGTGGMGRVWLARDRTLDRDVAIKVVAEELGANPHYRERFLREARTVARLRHDGIVSVHSAGEANGLMYLVMELVSGQSLRERITTDGRLPMAEAVAILADVSRALAAAHSRGVVHRDVKPENILLDGATGRAMVTDFGVAQAVESSDDDRMTATGMVVGSPRYMSPEQAVGERDLDGRSDIYSLGLVAYEILSGSEPFEATSAGGLLARRLTSDPVPLEEKAPDVSPEVAAVVTRALARERDARWPDGESFATALEAALAGEDPEAAVAALGISGSATGRSLTSHSTRATGRVRASRRRPLSGWRGSALALAVVAVLAAGVGAWNLTRNETPWRPTMLVLPFELVGGDSELEWLREGAVSMLTLDLAHWRDLGVVDYARTLDLLRAEGLSESPRIGPSDAQRLARATHANSYVLGRIQRNGDSLTVVAGIYDADANAPYASFTESASIDSDPRDLFDRLARDLLQLSGAPEITPSLAASTTPSLEAYREFLAGLRALNGWQLDSATRYFGRAIERDSGFALAYYKRALANGWRDYGGNTATADARLAVANAGRLSSRDRALVEAYLALSEGLEAAARGEREVAIEQLRAARQRYSDIILRDSLDAEAWYGLGDASFHATHVGEPMLEAYQRALNAFDRTLALDSSFHLAYQHKLNIYQTAALPGQPILLQGDSLMAAPKLHPDSASVMPEVRQARQRAAELAVREARHWVNADPDAAPAYRTLAEAYAIAADYPAAAGTLRRALARPSVSEPDMRYALAIYELSSGRAAEAMSVLEAARESAPADSLMARGGPAVAQTVAASAGVAMHAGRVRYAMELVELAASLSHQPPIFDEAGLSLSQLWRSLTALGGVAAGMPWTWAKPVVDSTLAAVEGLPDEQEWAEMKRGLPVLAMLVSGDSTYLRRLSPEGRAWSDSSRVVMARRALLAGDTARAAELARSLPGGDTLRNRAILEVALEAETLTAVGDLRGALASYQALEPSRHGGKNLDPGWAMLARSSASRAAIHAALGERDRAAALYEEFISYWANADPELQPQVQEARKRLIELRDASRSRTVLGSP